MLTGSPASPEQARDFCDRWPGMLRDRLPWFVDEVGVGAPSVEALDGLVVTVVGRIGEDRPVEPVPEWYDASLAAVGWSAYGAALAEGLMAWVAELHAARAGRPLPWVLDEDPKSAYHLKPVVDLPGIAPPWRQVMGALRLAQSGGDPGRLRSVVEHNLAQLPEGATAPHRDEDALVELTALGRGRWQVSFPEDIDSRLGATAYASLEEKLGGVDGVTVALMEDRDRALLSTRSDVDEAQLELQLDRLVRSLASP
ncbi:hypothetical protein [Nocardioides terrigena]|uniref:hypothetical protein n=1 Tax=Nocardioides terrigena TaxID=424797 RepID=UPI000D2FCDCC|nr:hypothetical protein [Nocardioides terrigena]